MIDPAGYSVPQGTAAPSSSVLRFREGVADHLHSQDMQMAKKLETGGMDRVVDKLARNTLNRETTLTGDKAVVKLVPSNTTLSAAISSPALRGFGNARQLAGELSSNRVTAPTGKRVGG